MQEHQFTLIVATGLIDLSVAILQIHADDPAVRKVVVDDLADCKKDSDFTELFGRLLPAQRLLKITGYIERWPSVEYCPCYDLISMEELDFSALAAIPAPPAAQE